MHSRSLLLFGPRRLQWVENALPTLGEDEILVRTTYGAISMGTELPPYRGDDQTGLVQAYPRMTGYESLGIVIDRGANVQDPAVGQRVVGFWGHRTHVVVNSRKVIPIPVGVDDSLALLTILSCDAAKGVLKADPEPSDSILITGAGTMGLMALHFLKHKIGAQQVVVSEPDSERREIARLIGADAVFAPDELESVVSGHDLGLECSGRDAAFALLQKASRHDGTIIVLSDGNVERLTLTPDFHRKELRVVGSSDGYDYQAHARWFFAAVRKDAGSLNLLFQLRISAGDLPACFEEIASGMIKPIKVLVSYD